jgi:hypothetical protein
VVFSLKTRHKIWLCASHDVEADGEWFLRAQAMMQRQTWKVGDALSDVYLPLFAHLYIALLFTPSIPRYKVYSFLRKISKYKRYCVAPLMWTMFYQIWLCFSYVMQTPLLFHVNYPRVMIPSKLGIIIPPHISIHAAHHHGLKNRTGSAIRAQKPNRRLTWILWNVQTKLTGHLDFVECINYKDRCAS